MRKCHGLGFLKCRCIIARTYLAVLAAILHCSDGFRSGVSITPMPLSRYAPFNSTGTPLSTRQYLVIKLWPICMILHLAILSCSVHFPIYVPNASRSCLRLVNPLSYETSSLCDGRQGTITEQGTDGTSLSTVNNAKTSSNESLYS